MCFDAINSYEEAAIMDHEFREQATNKITGTEKSLNRQFKP
jgi:hypothetical protein